MASVEVEANLVELRSLADRLRERCISHDDWYDIGRERIYVLHTSQFVKFGYTSDLSRRLREYVNANPKSDTLEIIGMFAGDRALERRVHRTMGGICFRRGETEWFRAEGPICWLVNEVRKFGYAGLFGDLDR